jgi:hypothetical protein
MVIFLWYVGGFPVVRLFPGGIRNLQGWCGEPLSVQAYCGEKGPLRGAMCPFGRMGMGKQYLR